MYQCNKCFEVFSEPHQHRWQRTHYDIGGYVEFCFEAQCPECGSDDIDELVMCPICEVECVHNFDEGQRENKYGVCPDCIDKFTELYEYASTRFPGIRFDYFLDPELTDALEGGRCENK